MATARALQKSVIEVDSDSEWENAMTKDTLKFRTGKLMLWMDADLGDIWDLVSP